LQTVEKFGIQSKHNYLEFELVEPPRSKDSSKQLMDDTQHDEAMDSLGIVVGEIANDFNNVLSLISGYVEMALSELPEGERARSDLEHVLAASDRGSDLVSRILTFSKKSKLQRDAINLDKAVGDNVAYIKQRLPQNIDFTSSIDEAGERRLLSSETEIFKIINSLFSNSMQSMSVNGGEISLRLDYFRGDSESVKQYLGLGGGEYARITVVDNGSGMDINTIENMYTPFFTTAREGGQAVKRAGLGLTTVFNIVSSHEGKIYVDSVPAEGTKFEVCLPVMESERVAQETELVDETHSSKRGHILFIDDEASIVRMANKMLEQNGYTVTSFTDGNAALDHFRQQPHEFDLIITDLIMPAISGTELASKLSAINPTIPIVLTTGFSEKITEATCKQWGISTVIKKPFTIRDLLTTIEVHS
jgi:CheY-like chemotaxis protein/nitrogen-specific signal transduction histidine kinase